MSSEELRTPFVNQVLSDKAVIAEKIDTLNIGEAVLLPTPNQLPPDIKFFTGRTKEIDELKKALSNDQSVIAICSLWGMGGIGKSALAIHVANQMYHEGYFQDGILFANLGEISVDDALVIFIQAFNYGERQIPKSHQGKVSLYRSLLRGKKVLILIDNVKDEEQALPFLVNEPTISIIFTSRKHLVALTEYSALIRDLDVFSVDEAKELLEKRLGTRYKTEPLAVSRICQLAGNLPLAISLAASSLADQKKWPILQKYVERLDESENLLDAFSRTTSKERSLRRVFQLSYETLSQDQKEDIVLLTLLEKNNFGSSGLVALTGKKKNDAIDQLDEFVNLSLLLRSDFGGYRFHDLILSFAKEKISDFSTAEVEAAYSRLKDYLFTLERARFLSKQASSNMWDKNFDKAIELCLQAQQINLKVRSRSEQANILGLLAFAYSQKDELNKSIEFNQQRIDLCKEIGNRAGLASSLVSLAVNFARKSEFDQSIEFFQQALSINRELGNHAGEAQALSGLASAIVNKGELDRAIQFYQQVLSINKKTGNHAGESSALSGLASVFVKKGEFDKAIEFYQKALSLDNQSSNQFWQAYTLSRLADTFAQKGDLDSAIEFYFKALTSSRRLGFPTWRASNLNHLALLFAQKGDFGKAIKFHKKALVINKILNLLPEQASVLGSLAAAYAQVGSYDKAIEIYQQDIDICIRIGNRTGQASALGGIADAYAQKDEFDKAIYFYRQDIDLCKEIGNRPGQAGVLGRLAKVLARKGEFDTAIDAYKEKIDLNREIGYLEGEASALAGIAKIYYQNKDWEKAIIYLEKTLEINRLNQNHYLSTNLYRLAICYKEIGDFKAARKFTEKAWQTTTKPGRDLVRLYNDFFSNHMKVE
jgi:tetratricopeptide (TPR) repeat protein